MQVDFTVDNQFQIAADDGQRQFNCIAHLSELSGRRDGIVSFGQLAEIDLNRLICRTAARISFIYAVAGDAYLIADHIACFNRCAVSLNKHCDLVALNIFRAENRLGKERQRRNQI